MVMMLGAANIGVNILRYSKMRVSFTNLHLTHLPALLGTRAANLCTILAMLHVRMLFAFFSTSIANFSA